MFNKQIVVLIIWVVFGFLPEIKTVRAADELVLRNSPRSMRGMRPLGMGDAFIAVDGSDENALFYNPAAINDFDKKVHMQFLLPTVDFSYKAISFFKDDLSNLADDIDGAATDAAKTDAFQNFTTSNAGRYEEVGVRGALANFMSKRLAASIFYENRSALALLNPANNEFTINALSQGGLQVGSAIDLFKKQLQVGLAVKAIERHLISETIHQRDIVANNDLGDSIDMNNRGFGIGGDVGIKAKPKLFKKSKAWKHLDPTFAVTLQDVGNTRFFSGDDVGRTQQSLSAGFALHPNFGKFKNLFTFDMRDLDHQTDVITKIHAGAESILPTIPYIPTVSLRIGMNQGYLTGGLGMDFKYFKLNAATYGQELARYTRQKQSRMFGLQLAAGF